MSERQKRDSAMRKVRQSPDNNYQQILDAARRWIIRLPPGEFIVCGQVFATVIKRHPHIVPREKRVMGPVMQSLAKEKLISQAGHSTRARKHRGIAQEWKRLHA